MTETEFPTPSPATSSPSVLFITRAYPPIRGGMEKFSYDLTTSIAARTRTHILANRHGKIFLPLFAFGAFLRALVNLPQYEILHLGDPVLSGLAWILKHVQHRPTAMTIHGLDILYPSPLYQRYLRRFLPSVDLYICISRYVEQTLRERFGLTRTIVIPPGIRDTFYRPGTTRSELTPILGSDPGARPILLTVARLVRRKGVTWFIGNVLPRLPEDILYVVVGDGPERVAAEEEARRHGVRARVLFTGAVAEETLSLFYNAADLFVMPNILVEDDVEGFGLVALEAASCTLPVIASAVQGIVDAVFDGRNGVLVEAGDVTGYVTEIERLIQDTTARKALGAHAREFTVSRFSWNIITQKYLDAFNHLRRL